MLKWGEQKRKENQIKIFTTWLKNFHLLDLLARFTGSKLE